MKKKILNDKIWLMVLLVTLAIGLGVFTVVGLIIKTNKIREFKVDVFVISYESDICIAEGPDGTVKMNSQNLPAIYSLIEKAKGRITFGEPKAVDTVVFNYNCHNEDWIMTVDKISDDKMRIALQGSRNYTMYLNNSRNFEAFQKAASAKGYVQANKVLEQK